MGYKFNPFTGNFDTTDSPNGVFDSVEVDGDITLDDGGAYATTLQLITPTANRTISFPDATGTVGLVGGSSGQVTYNNAGAQAGLTSASIGSTGEINISLAGAASTPPVSFTGSWFTGGTSTTTKPQVLIEPTGTTSTAWSTSGTGFGVNAPSGFAGKLLDLQVNGTSSFSVDSIGRILLPVNIGGASGPAIGIANYFNSVALYTNSGLRALANFSGFRVYGQIQFDANSDLVLLRDTADTLAQRRGANAQTLRVYGTYTDLSNHVRGSLSATSTAVTLAAETAGTGADDIPLNLTAAGTGTVKVNSVAEVAVSSTVAGLPATPAVGMLTRVTDASAPVVGFTVAGGGAAAALVWWNGSNWTVIGV